MQDIPPLFNRLDKVVILIVISLIILAVVIDWAIIHKIKIPPPWLTK